MRNNTVEIVLRANSAQFDRAVNNVRSRFTGAIRSMQQSARQGSTGINQAFSTLNIRSAAQIRREIAEVNLAFERLRRSSTLSNAEIGRASNAARARIAGLRQEISGTLPALNSMMGSVRNLFGAFAAAAAGKLSVDFLQDAVNAFTTFDDAARKAAAVTGDFDKAFGAFSAKARELGKSTSYSATEAATALQNLAMAGLGIEKSLHAIPQVLDLAKASSTDLGETADVVTNIMSGFGIAATDLSSASDVLTKTFTSSNTNLSQLGNAFKQAGPIAKSAGLEFKEVAAVLGVLANNGYKGEMGGTALRGAMARLIKPVKLAKQVLNDLGVSVHDSTGKMRPFTDIMAELAKKGITTAQTIALFGQEAGPAMASLLGQGTTAAKALMNSMGDIGGLTADLAKKMNSGLGGRLKELSSLWDDVKISMGEAMSDDAGIGVQNLTKFLRENKAALVDVAEAVSVVARGIADLTLSVGQGVLLPFNIYEAIKANQEFNAAGQETADIQARVAEKLTDVSNSTGMTIETMAQFHALVKDGFIVFDEASGNWIKASEAAKSVGTAIQESGNSFTEVTQKAASLKGELASISDSGFKTIAENVTALSAIIKTEYEAQTNNIRESLTTRLAEIENADISERDKLEQKTNAIISSHDAILTATKDYESQRLALINSMYAQQIEVATVLGRSTAKLEREAMEAKKGVYKEVEAAYKTTIDALIAEEQRHLKAALSAAEQRKNLAASTEDKIRELRRSGMDQYRARVDVLMQIDQKQSAARQALARGDFETAKQLVKQAESLTSGIASKVDRNGRTVISQQRAISKAIGETKQNAKILDQALAQQEKTHKKNATASRAAANEAKTGMEGVQAKVSKIDQMLKDAKTLKLKADISQVEAAISKLKETTHSTHIIHIQKQGGGVEQRAAGGRLPGFGGGDRVPALLEAGEWVIRKEAVKHYGDSFLNSINRIQLQKKRYGGLVQKYMNGGSVSGHSIIQKFMYGGAVSSGGSAEISVSAATSEAESKIDNLINKIKNYHPKVQVDAEISSVMRNLRRASKAISRKISKQRHAALVEHTTKMEQATQQLDQGIAKIQANAGRQIAQATAQMNRDIGKIQANASKQISQSAQQMELDIANVNNRMNRDMAQASDTLNKGISASIEEAAKATEAVAQRFAQQIQSIRAEAEQFTATTNDAILSIQQSMMTEEEVRVSKVMELREQQRAAREAIEQGELDKAREINAGIVQLVQSISGEVSDAAGNLIVSQEDAASQAIGFIEESQALNEEISLAREEKAESEKTADLEKVELEKSSKIQAMQAEYEQRVAAINNTAAQEAAAIRAAHQQRVASIQSQAQQEIAAVQQAHNQRVAAIRQAAQQQTIQLRQEHAQRIAAIQKEHASRLASIRAAGRAEQAQINKMKSMYGRLRNEANSLNSRVNSMSEYVAQQNRRANLNRNRLKSSMGFATGGRLPGYGGGDRIPVLTEGGEWVIRKEAVVKYGHDFMASINNMLLPAQRKYSDSIPEFTLPPIVQKFAAGGPVQSVERNVRDVVEIKLSLSGESVSGEFAAEDATYNLIQELKKAGLTNG